MGGLSGYEEIADDWTHVRAALATLVGTAVMDPGVVLWLDDGKRILVGDVNAHFGTGAHCLFPCLPVVKAWRKVFEVSSLKSSPKGAWATAFDLDDVPFEYAERSEWPLIAGIAQRMNSVGDLGWDGVLEPGLAVSMVDGRALLVGNVNPLAGVCDAEIDGRSASEGFEQRIECYMRVVPKSVLKHRPYHHR